MTRTLPRGPGLGSTGTPTGKAYATLKVVRLDRRKEGRSQALSYVQAVYTQRACKLLMVLVLVTVDIESVYKLNLGLDKKESLTEI